MKQLFRYVALAGALVVVTVAQAAETIIVEGAGTITPWDSLSPRPTADDTIIIRNSGTLVVSSATAMVAKEIRIGEGSTFGRLLYDAAAPRQLTVGGAISFGNSFANELDMRAGLTAIAHSLTVNGSFLASGTGIFYAGNGTVTYGGGSQTVQARVGGAGNDILYKNLTIQGSGTKTFSQGVNVQSVLTVVRGVTLNGSPVVYGAQGSLVYTGGDGDQDTSDVEWSPSTSLPIPVTITRSGGTGERKVKLNSSKSIDATLTIAENCILETASGRDVTARRTVANSGAVTGAGRVVLAGTSKQTLSNPSGSGRYGNVTLQNSAGAAVSTRFDVRGRLVIASGRLEIPAASANNFAQLLTHGTTDVKVPANQTWGSLASNAQNKSDTYYAGDGFLIYGGKFQARFEVSNQTATYGDSSITLTGKLTSVGENYGNGAVTGELVRVELSGQASQQVPVDSTGVFRATYTGAIYAADYPITYSYQGGDNLQGPAENRDVRLTVNKRNLTIMPIATSKTYGDFDPVIQYDYAPKPLVGTDQLTGQLSRQGAGSGAAGEQVSSAGYEIVNTHATDPVRIIGAASGSYNITTAPNRKLTIRKRNMTWIVSSASKIYGQNDPTFSYTVSPSGALVTRLGDRISGLPSRQSDDANKQNVGDDIDLVRNADMFVVSDTLPGQPDVTGNYALNVVPSKLTINPLAVTVGFRDGDKNFGEGDPSLDATFNPALVNNPTIGVADYAVGNLDRTKGEKPARDEVGKYDMLKGKLEIKRQGSDANAIGNYVLTFPTASFEIKRATLTARPKTINNLVYGDAIPVPNNPKADGLIQYDGLYVDGDYYDTLDRWGVVGNWDPRMPVQGDLPTESTSDKKPFKYTVTTKPTDKNYVLDGDGNIPTTPAGGELRIVKRPLRMTVDNKSMPYTGFVFDILQYSASFNFVLNDTADNSLTGGWTPSGDAVSASNPGVYPITVGANGYSSAKYTITEEVPGYLVITEALQKKVVGNPLTWGPAPDNWSMLIDKANGQAGANWSLLDLTAANGGGGTLTIAAGTDPATQFTIFVTTMSLGTQFPGQMDAFDPTRPYEWTVVRADSINDYAENKIKVYTKGPNAGGGFFANPTFGGTFGTKLVTAVGSPAELRVTYTPPSQKDMPNDDIPPLFAYLDASNAFDLLYLDPDTTGLNPQGQKLVVNVKVKNLGQQINGAQAYIKFDSNYFVSDPKSPNAPLIEAGGGVWDRVVFSYYSNAGDVDTVIGLSFTSSGTDQPGTLAKITLTPTRTKTGKSRVYFRSDSAAISGGIPGGTRLSATDGRLILPARVQTRDITITVDDQPPAFGAITATQDQYSISRNVKNYNKDDANTYKSVRTSDGAGKVKIGITAGDSGVGLNGAPTLRLKSPSGAFTTVKVDDGNPGGADGVYNYQWEINSGTENGVWESEITATDMQGLQKTADVFKLTVNKNLATGLVELDTFLGSSRDVRYEAGDGSKLLGSWLLPVSTTVTEFQPTGEFRNLPGFVDELLKGTDQMSDTTLLLRYGGIANLQTLVSKLTQGTDGLATYLRELWFGYFAHPNGLRDPDQDLAAFNYTVDELQMDTKPYTMLDHAPRHIDSYIRGRLTPETRALLDAYPDDDPAVAGNPQTPEMIAALESALLDDFNEIVLGPYFYDPVRFSTVEPNVRLNPEINALIVKYTTDDPNNDADSGNNPSGDFTAQDSIRLNRLLLNGAYPAYWYGVLNPTTARELANFTGGDNASLRKHIGADLYALTLPANMDWWQEAGVEQGSIYTQQRFLGVTFRSLTTDLLLRLPLLDPDSVALLNRMLLEDGLAFQVNSLNFISGPITPQTVTRLQNFKATPNQNNKINLDGSLATDLNNVLKSGAKTRSDLEFAYSGMITRYGTRGKFTLINVPDGTTRISAKTAWNLRETLPTVGTINNSNPSASVYFVNGENVERPENVKFDTVNDHYLRGGDIDANNSVDLTDLSLFQGYFRSNDPKGDITGDRVTNSNDYTVLRNRVGDSGDPVVGNP